jgi:ribose 5-phosphate isomerase B
MRIAVGSDHRGYSLKEAVLRYLHGRQAEYRDFGAPSAEPVDYSDIGAEVAEAVANGEFDRGIVICSTGIGMSITANKVPGIRAALCTDPYCAKMSRAHNDANVLALGSRITDKKTALDIVRVWLDTDYPAEGRHADRIAKIQKLEDKYNGGGR